MPWMSVLPRFREARRALPELARREQWTREEIDAWQLDRVNALWHEASQRSPYYRALRGRLDLPERFESFAHYEQTFPLLRKSVAREAGETLCHEQPGPGRWYKTGGSTGTPMRLFWRHDDYRTALRARYRFYESLGVELFDRTTFLWGGHHRRRSGWRGMLGQGQERLLDRLRQRQRLSAYQADPATLRSHLREIERFRPAMLYGFSNAVFLLAREARNAGFSCPSLKRVVMTSEVATDAMRQVAREGLGAPVTAEYGAMECPLIAGEDAQGRWRVREDLVRVETVAAANGRYEVVLTVLTNTAFPLLRYAIEDSTAAPLERPERGFAILPPIGGRCDDLLIDGGGRAVHATAVDAVFEEESAIRRYRVCQHADGSIRALLQPERPLAAERLAELERELSDAVPGRPVTVQVVETIPLSVGGKHRAVVCEMKRPSSTPVAAG